MRSIIKTENIVTANNTPALLTIYQNPNTEYSPENPDFFSIIIDGEFFLDNKNDTDNLLENKHFNVKRSNGTIVDVRLLMDHNNALKKYGTSEPFELFEKSTIDSILERRKLTAWLVDEVYDVVVTSTDGSDEVLHEIEGVYAFLGLEALLEEWMVEFDLSYNSSIVNLTALENGDCSQVICVQKNNSYHGQVTVGKLYQVHKEHRDGDFVYFIVDDNWDIWKLGNQADWLFEPYYP